MSKVCQITTAHPRYDIRIFVKECVSLAEVHETHLIVSDGKGDEVRNNVHIHDVGVKTNSRLLRFVKIVYRTYLKALELDCKIYHFHDPDFILAGVLLRLKGKLVIYDSHEDTPRQTLTKEYLGAFSSVVAYSFEIVENWAAKRYSAVVTATPFIAARFAKLNAVTRNVNNYPLLKEVSVNSVRKGTGKIAYIGAITKDKGIMELIEALGEMPVTLELAGEFESITFKERIIAMPGWKKVNYHGTVTRSKILELLQSCSAGMVTFNPTPNYINALPIKMFEYMASGLPVVCSDFELWKEIVQGNHCGICVNPMDPKDIAKKTMVLLEDQGAIEQMGKNGIKAVSEKYNWEVEKQKLFKLYRDIDNTPN